MTKDDSLEYAVIITEYLLDNCPELLDPRVLEQQGKYTEYTFELQDYIEEAVRKVAHSPRLPYTKNENN